MKTTCCLSSPKTHSASFMRTIGNIDQGSNLTLNTTQTQLTPNLDDWGAYPSVDATKREIRTVVDINLKDSKVRLRNSHNDEVPELTLIYSDIDSAFNNIFPQVSNGSMQVAGLSDLAADEIESNFTCLTVYTNSVFTIISCANSWLVKEDKTLVVYATGINSSELLELFRDFDHLALVSLSATSNVVKIGLRLSKSVDRNIDDLLAGIRVGKACTQNEADPEEPSVRKRYLSTLLLMRELSYQDPTRNPSHVTTPNKSREQTERDKEIASLRKELRTVTQKYSSLVQSKGGRLILRYWALRRRLRGTR